MGYLICPHCKNQTETLWDDELPDAYFWCNVCGEISLHTLKPKFVGSADLKLALVAPTPEEEILIHNEWDEKHPHRLASNLWLPKISKNNLHFEVMIIKDGIMNAHEIAGKYDFFESERLAKLVFHKVGIMPQVGDFVKGKRTEKNEMGYFDEEDFVIIGRNFGENDYETMQLFVVFEEDWIKKQGY